MKLDKNKKGYTVVEAIISIAITLLLIPIIISVFLNSISEFKRYIQYSIDLNNLDSSTLNISEIVRANGIISIDSNNYKIRVSMQQDLDSNLQVRKDIYLDENRLFVETLDNSRYDSIFTSRAKNVLIRDVKNFEVIKKENLIYYLIEMESGIKRIVCL